MVPSRLLLALVLCVTGVQFDRGPIDAVAQDASGPKVSSAASASAAPWLRGKGEKACAIDALAPPDTTALFRPGRADAPSASYAPQPPSLTLSLPPLAPRPPPAA